MQFFFLKEPQSFSISELLMESERKIISFLNLLNLIIFFIFQGAPTQNDSKKVFSFESNSNLSPGPSISISHSHSSSCSTAPANKRKITNSVESEQREKRHADFNQYLQELAKPATSSPCVEKFSIMVMDFGYL